jgi:hypothetical protein
MKAGTDSKWNPKLTAARLNDITGDGPSQLGKRRQAAWKGGKDGDKGAGDQQQPTFPLRE